MGDAGARAIVRDGRRLIVCPDREHLGPRSRRHWVDGAVEHHHCLALIVLACDDAAPSHGEIMARKEAERIYTLEADC